jgi:glycosyltransferase involved in cell wall biosynthesis
MAGHDVTLYAPESSATDQPYKTIIAAPIGPYENERKMAKAVINDAPSYDVIIDHTHTKVVSYYAPHLPILSWYHDIFMEPGAKNSVMVSEGMKSLPGMNWGKDCPVVHHWVDENEYTFNPAPDEPPYALFLGLWRDYKQPMLAVQACTLADIRLVVAGTIPGTVSPFSRNDPNLIYVGGLVGEQKVQALQRASVLLQFGDVEAFGLTTAEAALCGTPVVAWPAGGTLDLLEYRHGADPTSGVYIQVSRAQARSAADSIKYAMSLNRQVVRDAMAFRVAMPQHVQAMTRVIKEVVNVHED